MFHLIFRPLSSLLTRPALLHPQLDILETHLFRLVIADCRARTNVYANNVMGGGVESETNYPQCSILHMGLENIHVIRDSYVAMTQLCLQARGMGTLDLPHNPHIVVTDFKFVSICILEDSDVDGWYTKLETTKWLFHIRNLLIATQQVKKPVISK